MADDEDDYERVLVEQKCRSDDDRREAADGGGLSVAAWPDGDELRPARGVVKGVAAGAAFWIVIAGLLWLV